MDEQYKAQENLVEKIHGLPTKFTRLTDEPKDIDTIECFLERLEDYFHTFQNHHKDILDNPELNLNNNYFRKKVPELAEDAYYLTKAFFKRALREFDEERHNSTIQTPAGFDESSHCKLPPIQIPQFSGKQVDWINFRDLFDSMVHQSTKYNDGEKFFYLRSYVTGKALDLIKNISLDASNYRKAWTALKNHFENKRRLINFYLHDLLSVKPMKAESHAALNKLHKEISTPLEALKALDRPDLWSDFIVFLTANCFDENTQRDWQISLSDSNEPPTSEQLDKFIQERLATLESLESCFKPTSSGTNNSSRPNTKDKRSNFQTSQQTASQSNYNICALCNKNHFIIKCFKFIAMKPKERKKVASDNQLCFNCLGKHLIQDCKSDKRCTHCGNKHHSLLHFNLNVKCDPSVNVQQSSLESSDDESETIKSTKSCVKSRSSEFNENQNRIETNASNSKNKSESKRSNKGTQETKDCSSKISHTNNRSAKPSCSNDDESFSGSAATTGGVLLATALIKVQGQNGIELKVRALIDSCSQATFITESLCQRLKLNAQRVQIPIKGTGGSLIATVKKITKINIKPHFKSSFISSVDALVLQEVSSYRPPLMSSILSLSHLKGLQLADPRFMDSSHIDVLLGAAVFTEILDGEIIKGKQHEPAAIKTSLGWVLSGKITGESSISSLTSLHTCNQCDLDKTLQSFWIQEKIPQIKILSKDEQECEDHFLRTYARNQEGRFILRLPFKGERPTKDINLGESVNSAKKMLYSMERRFQSDPELEKAYHTFLTEYEKLGHMSRIAPLNEPFDISDHFFLPHHGVWKMSSTTTKLRTVFNGSAKLKSGISLNDLLHAGPNLLPHLFDIVNSWRKYKYVFAADIEKMFRQILIHPDDQKYQSILWRFNKFDLILIILLLTLVYGLNSSPYMAHRTLKQLALEEAFIHPLGAEVVNEEVYVDDVLSGGHTKTETKLKRQDVDELLKSGGFPLRKWVSNNIEILENIPQENLVSDVKYFTDSYLVTSVLGLSWNPSLDQFNFKVQAFEPTKKLTKRIILSRISKIFDPMGWLAPIIVIAKVFMQSLWLSKLDWDSELTIDQKLKWKDWEIQLPLINNIVIPRWNHYTPKASIVELHIFSDASKSAYGSVGYLRVVHENQVYVTLLSSKSKVAPLKILSIPRLELAAMHLSSKLVKHYIKQSKFEFSSVHLWTDSMDVLFWLQDHPSRWVTFVANRCSAIIENCPDASFHHVKSKENPADVVSRGCSVDDLRNKDLWWTGPTFLSTNTLPWSTSLDQKILDELNKHSIVEVDKAQSKESSKVVHFTVIHKYEWEFLQKYSSLTKLRRVLAYVLRFVYNLLRRIKNLRLLERNTLLECFNKYIQYQNQIQQVRPVNELLNKIQTRLGSGINSILLNLDSDETCLNYVSNFISPSELLRSEKVLTLIHQRVHFAKELQILKQKGNLPKSHRLNKLRLYIDGELIRVGGRLGNALLPLENKHPLLLNPHDALTRLFILKVHLDTFHSGTSMTLGTLRLTHWVVYGRNAVKNIINKCLTCRRYGNSRVTQLMGDLPAPRVNPSSPFSETGVDYAGPISIRLSKSRGNHTLKGYISIFVCFSTRAVHIELVEDYSSEAFIGAFHRFTARRGHCAHLYSDQGTTFVGADNRLQELFIESSESFKQIFNALASASTTWHFNPPGAPHFGGLWEAAVKSAKRLLRRVIGDHILTFVELYTLLCRIEAILNSRPMLPLVDDINDIVPLTPAHFLIHRPSFLVPEPNYTNQKIPLSKRWELVSQMTQHFWNQWSREYLTTLQTRTKWTEKQRSLQIGDLVLIRNETTAPGNWPLGIITSTYPGKDGLVRAVSIKTAQSQFDRPVVKVLLLSTNEDLLET